MVKTPKNPPEKTPEDTLKEAEAFAEGSPGAPEAEPVQPDLAPEEKTPEDALKEAVAAAEGAPVVPEVKTLTVAQPDPEITSRWFAVTGPVLHDGEHLRENDAAYLTQPQFDALLRAGAIDAGAVWLDGEPEDNEV